MAFLIKLGAEEVSDLEQTLKLKACGLSLPSETFRFCTATNGISAVVGNTETRRRLECQHVSCLVLRQVHVDVEKVAEYMAGPGSRFIETIIVTADVKSGMQIILESASRLSHLRALILRGVKLDDSDVNTLSRIASRGMLKILQMPKSGLGDSRTSAFCRALEPCSLVHLSLARNEIRQAAWDVAHSLSESTTLSSLSLNFNPFGPMGIASIATVVSQNSVLTALNLSYTAMGKEGASHLAASLRLNSSLLHLHLGGNNIGPEGAEAVIEAAKGNRTLQTLCLHNNHLKDAGLCAVLTAFSSLSLQHCDVTLNMPSPLTDRAVLTLARGYGRDLRSPLPPWLQRLSEPVHGLQSELHGMQRVLPGVEMCPAGWAGEEWRLQGGAEGWRDLRSFKMVVSHQDAEQLLAIAMSQHARLGAEAACGVLSEALLHHIVAAHWPCQPRVLLY